MGEREIEHSCEIVINAPPAHVFTILTDLEQYLARWAKGPIAAKKLTDGPTTSDTRSQVTARIAVFRVRSPYTVTATERDQRFAGKGIAGPVRFSEEYRLQTEHDAGDRTRLRYAMRAEPRGIFRLAREPIAGRLRRLLDSDLERFKMLVETTPRSEAAT
ncbi:MAG: SRPBCC family protein [Solirubrobacterales bacterium]|nr:SRPBCC family protein [Solirubrobacterales bacterium]